MPLAEVFGRNVKTARLERGLSQEALAERAEIHQSQISDIENGRNTSFLTVEKIADALGVDRLALLTDPQPTRRRS